MIKNLKQYFIFFSLCFCLVCNGTNSRQYQVIADAISASTKNFKRYVNINMSEHDSQLNSVDALKSYHSSYENFITQLKETVKDSWIKSFLKDVMSDQIEYVLSLNIDDKDEGYTSANTFDSIISKLDPEKVTRLLIISREFLDALSRDFIPRYVHYQSETLDSKFRNAQRRLGDISDSLIPKEEVFKNLIRSCLLPADVLLKYYSVEQFQSLYSSISSTPIKDHIKQCYETKFGSTAASLSE